MFAIFPPSTTMTCVAAGITCLCVALSGCSAVAASAQADSAHWPQPAPQPANDAPAVQPATPWPAQGATIWRNAPNFSAPSATHCARPIQTREWPGQTRQGQGPREWSGDAGPRADDERREAVGTAAPAMAARERDAVLADRAEKSARVLARPAPMAAPAPAPSPAAGAPATSGLASAEAKAPQPGNTASMWPPRPAPRVEAPTAGMVDDNADFSAYLNFRERNPVPHLARDVRERHLLQVKDANGQGVADAEVSVQARSGHAMWARTDTAGRVWLHPDAFDPARSDEYRVLARKGGVQGESFLRRGQKSAVELKLDERGASARARLDLVFLIDATGSMADEIEKLRVSLKSIVADVARMPSQPDLCLGLVAYRDRGDAFLWRTHDLTQDVDAFQRVLNGLRASGGGDYPEAMNEALHETVHSLAWRGEGATRIVVLLADAPPHLDYGGPRYDEDMMAALGKGIKVFSVGASGLDRQGEFIQRQIAQYTGGRFVFLTYANASNPASGNGRETVHDVSNYSVETLDRLIVRLVGEELGRLHRKG